MQKDYASPAWAEHHLELSDALHGFLLWIARLAVQQRQGSPVSRPEPSACSSRPPIGEADVDQIPGDEK
jgi:hypothetical protein